MGKVTHRTFGYGSILERPKVSLRVSVDKRGFISNLEPAYVSWRDELREEDERCGVSEDLDYMSRLSYPALDEFLEHPDEFGDYICNYGREEVLALYANADDDDATSCINEIISVEVTEDTVEILTVA